MVSKFQLNVLLLEGKHPIKTQLYSRPFILREAAFLSSDKDLIHCFLAYFFHIAAPSADSSTLVFRKCKHTPECYLYVRSYNGHATEAPYYCYDMHCFSHCRLSEITGLVGWTGGLTFLVLHFYAP